MIQENIREGKDITETVNLWHDGWGLNIKGRDRRMVVAGSCSNVARPKHRVVVASVQAKHGIAVNYGRLDYGRR